jgi:hypothetical protein
VGVIQQQRRRTMNQDNRNAGLQGNNQGTPQGGKTQPGQGSDDMQKSTQGQPGQTGQQPPKSAPQR